jgi:hypothetical protein
MNPVVVQGTAGIPKMHALSEDVCVPVTEMMR